MIFPERAAYNQQIVKVGGAYADAGVSRARTPAQIGNFLALQDLPPDMTIPYCALFGSWLRCHSYCDLQGIPYNEKNVVAVFRAVIPMIEAHDIKISASCEVVRQDAIARGNWISVEAMPDDLVFKPGWVFLWNFETEGPEAHHYTTCEGDSPGNAVKLIEGNTSSASQGNGGAVAHKVRDLSSRHFRGVVRTW